MVEAVVTREELALGRLRVDVVSSAVDTLQASLARRKQEYEGLVGRYLGATHFDALFPWTNDVWDYTQEQGIKAPRYFYRALEAHTRHAITAPDISFFYSDHPKTAEEYYRNAQYWVAQSGKRSESVVDRIRQSYEQAAQSVVIEEEQVAPVPMPRSVVYSGLVRFSAELPIAKRNWEARWPQRF